MQPAPHRLLRRRASCVLALGIVAVVLASLAGCSSLDELGDDLRAAGAHDTSKGSVEGQGAARER